MSTLLLDFVADAQSSVKMRWEEPYVTEGLNKKLAFASPRGIYRGFRLIPSITAMNVTVQADPVTLDHVIVYESATGYSLAVHRSPGNFDLNLSSFANQTIVIAVYAVYTIGNPTSAQLAAYQLAPTDQYTTAPEFGEIISLGQVVVPSSGVIPSANITPQFRTSAWENWAGEVTPFSPIIQNAGFESGPIGTVSLTELEWLPDWTFTFVATNAILTVIGTDNATSRGRRCLALQAPTSGSVSVPRYVVNNQYLMAPVYPGQRIKMGMKYKPIVANTGDAYQLVATFISEESTSGSPVFVNSDTIPMTTASSSWTDYSFVFEVPAGAGFLTGFALVNTLTAAYTSPGTNANLLLVDDLQIWLESEAHLASARSQSAWGIKSAGSIRFRDTEDGLQWHPPSVTARDAVATFKNNIINTLAGWLFQRADESMTNADQPALAVAGPIAAGFALTTGSTAQKDTPRIRAQISGATYSPILTFDTNVLGVLGGLVTFYTKADLSSTLVITLNATWSTPGNDWAAIGSGNSYKLTFSNFDSVLSAPSFRIEVFTAGGTWLDSAWQQLLYSDMTVDGTFGGFQSLAFQDPAFVVKFISGFLGSSPAWNFQRTDGSSIGLQGVLNAWGPIFAGFGLDPNTDLPRLIAQAPSGSLWVPIVSAVPTGSFPAAVMPSASLYYNDSQTALALVTGAQYDSGTTTWSYTTGSTLASRWVFSLLAPSAGGTPSLTIDYHSGGLPWLDAAWSNTASLPLESGLPWVVNNPLTVTDSTIKVTGLTNETIPSFVTNPAAGFTYTAVWSSNNALSSGTATIYESAVGEYLFVVNATWSEGGPLWHITTPGKPAYKMSFTANGVEVFSSQVTSGTFSDSQWQSMQASTWGAAFGTQPWINAMSGFIDNTADGLLARLHMEMPASGNILLFSFGDTTGSHIKTRVYAASGGTSWFVTLNAAFNISGQWTKDVSASPALYFSVGGGSGISFGLQTTNVASFTTFRAWDMNQNMPRFSGQIVVDHSLTVLSSYSYYIVSNDSAGGGDINISTVSGATVLRVFLPQTYGAWNSGFGWFNSGVGYTVVATIGRGASTVIGSSPIAMMPIIMNQTSSYFDIAVNTPSGYLDLTSSTWSGNNAIYINWTLLAFPTGT